MYVMLLIGGRFSLVGNMKKRVGNTLQSWTLDTLYDISAMYTLCSFGGVILMGVMGVNIMTYRGNMDMTTN